MRIGTGKHSVGLGDVLLLTPICNQLCKKSRWLEMPTVELPPQKENLWPLFRGIAKVSIVEEPVETPNEGDDHFARCKLRALGLDVDDYLPRVITEYCGCPADDWTIMYCTNASVKWQALRGLPDNVREHLAGTVGGRLLACGGYREPIREKIQRFKMHPRYIGADTGDYHLMLALGGKCIVFVPDDCPDYEYRRWHYDSDRVVYVNFKEYERVDQDFVSDFFG
jgi:hypothetical protein